MEESTDTKRIWGRQTNLIGAIRHGTLEKVIMLISKNQSIVMEENCYFRHWEGHVHILEMTYYFSAVDTQTYFAIKK